MSLAVVTPFNYWFTTLLPNPPNTAHNIRLEGEEYFMLYKALF